MTVQISKRETAFFVISITEGGLAAVGEAGFSETYEVFQNRANHHKTAHLKYLSFLSLNDSENQQIMEVFNCVKSWISKSRF